MKNLLITFALLLVIILGFLAGQYFSRDISISEDEFALLGESSECQLSDSACEVSGYTLEFKSRPVRPLQPIPVEMHSDIPLDNVVLDLEMIDMDMGVNRFRLKETGQGVWSGEIMIPVCTTGRRDWIANMLVESKQIRGKVVYSFVVQ